MFFYTMFILFFTCLYFSLFLNFNQTYKNLISLISFFILMSLFIIFYFHFEFLGYAYMLVYVGAVAVLFLFLIISVDIRGESKKQIFTSDLINFFFLFVTFFYSIYFFFLSLYNKLVNNKAYALSYYLNTKNDVLTTCYYNKGLDAVFWEYDSLETLYLKYDLIHRLNSLLLTIFRNGSLNFNISYFINIKDNKIFILGDYFLNYNSYILIIIGLLLFISTVVSVTICLSCEKSIKQSF